MDRINSIETFETRVPLPQPLSVGSALITHRSYSVVRITTEDGITGVGYCYSRGLPITKIIDDVMTPVIIGKTSESPHEIRRLVLGFNWQSAEHGTLTAGLSAIDIALNDIGGKRLGKSIASMLGAQLSELPIYSVVGYHYGKDEAGLEEEIDFALSRGINSFKIVFGAETPERDVKRLKVLREKVGDSVLIAVDAFRTLSNLENAITRVNLIKEFGISFVEDPFLESEGVAAIALREATGVPVSFGESLASSKMAEQALYYNHVDVLRIDALVIGGVSEFLKAVEYANSKGKTFATHIHTEIHSQLAAATPNLYPGGLEYLDPRYEIDLFHHLLLNPIEIRNGKAILNTEPGFGIQWDWQAIERYSS
ncbi:MAG: mandelate racemase/muconate lactonizing enzyme family protein [Candidatus Planktophila sp.]|nr:mandelate racemase/muconate lactonizing enzyme family protein [Candidatus Planktophila sp.]